MSKTAEVYLFVFILLVILFGVLLFLRNKKHPPRTKRGGQEQGLAVPQPAPPQAAPPKKHHLFKTVAKTGLMVAPLALLAL
jgi:hypothetical protein